MLIPNKRQVRAMCAVLFATLIANACGDDAANDDADNGGPDPSRLEGEGAGNGTASAANRDWWRGISQAERNQRILDRAATDIGRNVGLNCKQWARQVVLDASRGAVELPPTSPNEDGWSWYPGAGAAGMNANIRSVQPGWIVQMNIPAQGGGYTPHTAIVAGVSASGINWVDSNFVGNPTTKNYVGTHFETFEHFERATLIGGSYRYSVYVIIGTY